MAEPTSTPTWAPVEVRAWVERHGANVSRLARRLDVRRSSLQDWLSDGGRSPLPRYVQRHMEDLDRLARHESIWDGAE